MEVFGKWDALDKAGVNFAVFQSPSKLFRQKVQSTKDVSLWKNLQHCLQNFLRPSVRHQPFVDDRYSRRSRCHSPNFLSKVLQFYSFLDDSMTAALAPTRGFPVFVVCLSHDTEAEFCPQLGALPFQEKSAALFRPWEYYRAKPSCSAKPIASPPAMIWVAMSTRVCFYPIRLAPTLFDTDAADRRLGAFAAGGRGGETWGAAATEVNHEVV